jgi:hypothetical protein
LVRKASLLQDSAAIDTHKQQPHFKPWFAFKQSGGVLTQTVVKADAIDFGSAAAPICHAKVASTPTELSIVCSDSNSSSKEEDTIVAKTDTQLAAPASETPKPLNMAMPFVSKFRGEGASLPPYPPLEKLLAHILCAFLGSFLSIGIAAALHYHVLAPIEKSMIVASFGATAVLVHVAYDSPLAQPRNVILGSVISAVIGMGIAKLLSSTPWLASALAVSLAIVVQILLRVVHPPAGAAALIPCLLPSIRDSLGWWYILTPILPGCCILVACAALVNNLSPYRRYPKYWVGGW